jgi:protein O-mannosyl-transferase
MQFFLRSRWIFSHFTTRPLIPLLIVLVVAVVFRESLENGFTNWDDDTLVLDSPLIRSLSLENLGRICTSYPMGSQGPVATLSLALDFRIGGLDPRVFHGTALLLHLANCVLLYYLLLRLGLARLGSLFAALLFGVHPMHVESVAWISERKDLVSTLFFLTTMLLYQGYLATASRRRYLLCLLSFILALASKPMTVSLPFVLFLLDYLARRRWSAGVILEKIPFFLFAGAAALLTWTAQRHAMPEAEPLNDALIALRGIAFYLLKLVLPVNQSAFYPYPDQIGILEPEFLLSLIVLALLGLALALSARFSRVPLFGALFFCVTILPVLKFVPVGNTAAADRYTYIPSIGLFFAAGVLADFLLDRCRARPKGAGTANGAGRKVWLAGFLALIVLPITLLGAAAHERCKVWRDSETLWNDVIDKHPKVAMVHYNLGNVLFEKNRLNEAFEAYDRAAGLDGSYAQAFNNMARILWLRKNVAGCEEYCRKALAIDPDLPEAYLNISFVFNATGRYEEALDASSRVIRKSPNESDAWYSRGFALARLGRRTEAVDCLDKAAELDPLLSKKVRTVKAEILQ